MKAFEVAHPVSRLLLLLSTQSLAATQRIFIDNVQPGYADLSACADLPLSTLVRDMMSGCGDDQMTTSFSCFCGRNSTDFVTVISTDVESHCTEEDEDAGAQATAAVEVFNSYCHLTPRNATAVYSRSGPSAPPPTDFVPPTSTANGPTPTSSATTAAISRWLRRMLVFRLIMYLSE
ncbi:hypothetical protein S40293_10414 [Stachybotrys chartarum IBT 40293]|nr:hypothetical protein S40293_10414 [Stachybotrys chartarum IBT 40293]